MKPLPLLIACSTALACVVACSRAEAAQPPFLVCPAAYSEQSAASVTINYPPDVVEQICRRWGRGEPACAFTNGVGRCVIVIPTLADWRGAPWTYPPAVKHEDCHCNGWPADHSDPSRGQIR